MRVVEAWRRLLPLEQILVDPYSPPKPDVITVIFALPPITSEELRSTLVPRLLAHPRFKATLHRSRRVFTPQPTFTSASPQISDHIHCYSHLSSPITHSDFLTHLSKIVSTPLDLSKPLWHLHLFPNYALHPSASSTLILRVHHAVADGIGLLKFFSHVIADSSDNPTTLLVPPRRAANHKADKQTTTPWRKIRNFCRDFNIIFIHSLRKAPNSILTSTPVQQDNICDVKLASFSLDTLKSYSKALNVTINDVFFTALTGAIRTYLEEHNDTPDTIRHMRVAMPFANHSWDVYDPSDVSNQLVMLPVTLPVHITSREARLVACRDAMNNVKQGLQPALASVAMRGLACLPQKLRRMLWHRVGSGASLLFSNVPGPREKMALGGKVVHGIWFLPPPDVHVAFDIGVFSYGGQVFLTAGGDVGRMKEPRRVLELLEEEVEMLGKMESMPTKSE